MSVSSGGYFIRSNFAQFDAGTAILSILIGNLILWLIAMTMISMIIDDRMNAIENVKHYLGKYGAVAMGFVLIIAFIGWFVLQIDYSIPPIGKYFSIEKNETLVRFGAGIGFFTALLSVGGIRFIKWVCKVSLPALFCFFLYSIFQSQFSIMSIKNWGISSKVIFLTILIFLPGMVNLPTLFRHGKSREQCYFGLTLMILLVSFFEIGSFWIKSDVIQFSTLSIFFISLTFIATNLLNIYVGSAIWESFVPRFEGAKGYAIIGLIGTATYTFFQIYSPVRYFEDLSNYYIASLGVVLLISFLVSMIVKHRPRHWEQLINCFCWFIGCLTATLSSFKYMLGDIHPLLVGVATSAFLYLFILFVEESVWSGRKLFFAVSDERGN